MTCKHILALALVAGAGCVDDVPTLYATTTAMVSVQLAPPDVHIPTDFGYYRWELVEVPPFATDAPPVAETATLSITPSTRGIYVYDRWFVGEAAAQVTHHVVVTVDGAVPIAHAVGPSMVTIGETTALDGSTSVSPEHRGLGYQWRLAVRPESSTTMLVSADASTLMFVPDVTGEYGIELRVFDGELWSQPSTVMLVAR